MTRSEIDDAVALFTAAGRRNIPVPISEWREMQMARVQGKVVEKGGKKTFKPVEKGSVSAKIGRKAKADRTVKAWKSKSKA